MAITEQQKANALFKKFQGKADTSPFLEFYEEPLKSSFIVTPENFWIDTEYIPDTAPQLSDREEYVVEFENGFTLPVLRKYEELWLDPVPGSDASFYHEELADAIPHDYKDGSYHYTLKDAQGQELAYGLNSWVVDFQAGVLTFYSGIPELAKAPFRITFYRYIGRKTFEGVIKTDGTTPMVEEYNPERNQDVTTKKYVDSEVAYVQNIVDRLKPDKPPFLLSRALVSDTYTAYSIDTGEEHLCVGTPNPVIKTSGPFWNGITDPGDIQQLLAYVDGTQVGLKILDHLNNVSVNGQLEITEETDPYAGENQKQNFWKQIQAQINAVGLSLDQHTAKLVTTNTGETPEFSFWVDDPQDPTVRSGMTVTLPESTVRYVSGVPSLSIQDRVYVRFLVENIASTHYGQLGAVVTSSHLQNSECAITSPSQFTGDKTIQFEKQLEIRPNVYTETLQFQIVGLNSKREPGQSRGIDRLARIDTVSDESKRVSSGVGTYPASYGQQYDSSQSLSDNEELQLINGTFRWPAGDYSQNMPIAGPNYDLESVIPSSGVRWATFQSVELQYADGVILRINGAQSWKASSETRVTSDVYIQIKVDSGDPAQSTGWLDCNTPYPGVGIPQNDGDAAMIVSDSSATIKRVSFGPTTRSGRVFVRIGMKKGSTKFSTITVTPN